MKKFFYLLILSISMTTVVNAQQVSLYDSEGEARAYIDYDNEATIYLWNGTPVAFLEKDGSDLCVFGFNGKFLGWYESGIIYEKQGYPIGAKKGAIKMMTRMERMKGMQKMTPMRSMTSMTPMKPMWKSSWSSNLLTEILYIGEK